MLCNWKKPIENVAYQAEVGPFLLFAIPCNSMVAQEPNPYAGLYGIRLGPRSLDVWTEHAKGYVDVVELMGRAERELQRRLSHACESLDWSLLEPAP